MNENSTKKPSFFMRFKKGLVVIVKSLTFIWRHKKLVFFPLLTGILIIGTVGLYDVVYQQLYHTHITAFFPQKSQPQAHKDRYAQYDAMSDESEGDEINIEFILFCLIITFACIFFFTVSNVALSYAAGQAFMGLPVRLGASLLHSIKRFPTLLMWSVSAFFIHLLVNLFKGKNGKGSSFLNNLIGAALEFGWYIATFLVIPVLAHENLGAIKSIRRSTELMKKTFGENLAAALLLPQLIGLLLIAWLLISLGILYATIYLDTGTGITLFLTVGLPLIGLLLILTALVCCAVSAATTVFKTAAYYYAIGSQ